MGDFACSTCWYYRESEDHDKECQFPWFDYSPEDILKKACAKEDDADGEIEY